jgi:type II secretory pathway pseudopilin PulG
MRSYRKNRAFSTLEVLAAVTVVIILAAILLGVGKRLKTQAEEKLAKSTIQILVTAIGQYYEFWDKFPVADPCDAPDEHSEDLYSQLDSTPSSKSFCAKIDTTMIGDTNNDAENRLEFLDPWGRALDYRYSIGDSFPQVISGGPDGNYDTKSDNITSRDM